MVETTTDLRDARAVIALLDAAADALRASPLRQGCAVRLPARGRLLATGDLHDNPIHLRKIMKLAQVDVAPDHHVILHEMIHGERLINGVDLSHRMLLRAAELVGRFPQQVHPLLANHELAQMTGSGISKGAGNSVELFNDGLDFVFGEESVEVAEAIERFIAAMPLALVSASGLLCAHSLPAPHMMDRFDPAVLDRELREEDYRAPAGVAYLMAWGRGHKPEQLDVLAAAWNVKLFCIGHEHVETGIEIKPPRLILLNSDHDRAMVLPIDLAALPTAEETILRAIPLSTVTP